MAKEHKVEPIKTVDAEDLRGKFHKIGEQLIKVVVDFTTLNVTTLSGDITKIINSKQGKNAHIDFKNVLKDIETKGEAKTKVYVVAHTHIDFDHDTVNFIKTDLKREDAQLFQYHLSAIESAQQARKSFLHFLKEFR